MRGEGRGGRGEESLTYQDLRHLEPQRNKDVPRKDSTLGQDEDAVAGGTGGGPSTTQFFLLKHNYFLNSGPTVNDNVIEEEEEDELETEPIPQDPRSRGSATQT